MRPVTVLIFTLLIFVIDVGSATTALSHGALAICIRRFGVEVSASKDAQTPEAAHDAARDAFESVYDCFAPQRYVYFSDACIAVVTSPVSPDAPPVEEKQFWIRPALSGQEATTDAFDACRSTMGISCALRKLVCDGQATQAEPQVQTDQKPNSIPDRPKFSVDAVVKEIPADPLFSLATLNRFIEFASDDVRRFISQYDLYWVAMIAATAAVCLFVGTQLYSVIRTGRRRLRDIAFNASVAVLVVFAGTIVWLVCTSVSYT